MAKKVKSFVIFLLLLIILAVIVIGCGGDDDEEEERKKKENQDKINKEALKRNATVVAEEAKKLGLAVCTGESGPCATSEGFCKFDTPASEPGVCGKKEPVLKCICPEKTVCVMKPSGEFLTKGICTIPS